MLTDEEIHRLVDVASGFDGGFEHITGWKVLKNHRDKALVLALLDTGLRLGEITSLHVADLQDGWLMVNGKTGERQVPVSTEVLGHDKIETTMLYVTLAGVDVAADHAKYSPVGQLGLVKE